MSTKQKVDQFMRNNVNSRLHTNELLISLVEAIFKHKEKNNLGKENLHVVVQDMIAIINKNETNINPKWVLKYVSDYEVEHQKARFFQKKTQDVALLKEWNKVI